MIFNDCPECGRPVAKNREKWISDLCESEQLCGVHTEGVSMLPIAHENCRRHTIDRLKVRVAVLEQQLTPRLRVWELHSGRDVWVVAADAEDCWSHLLDHEGAEAHIDELKLEGIGWVALPDDKKISVMLDSDGDICGIEDGTPVLLPCWVWAAMRGVGFLAETE